MTQTTAAVSTKWYKTTGGKIGIFLGVTALITGIVLAVKHFTNSDPEKKSEEVENDLKEKVESSAKEIDKKEEVPLPNGGVGCGPLRKNFDRVYDYVKCAGIWYTISKDRVKIPEWKSLSNNKTATDLLNNKYPN